MSLNKRSAFMQSPSLPRFAERSVYIAKRLKFAQRLKGAQRLQVFDIFAQLFSFRCRLCVGENAGRSGEKGSPSLHTGQSHRRDRHRSGTLSW